MIKIYTDGSCSGHSGVGGWGAVIVETISAPLLHTTCNRAELAAVLNALRYVAAGPRAIEIHTDSLNTIGWLQEGWRRSTPIKKLCIQIEDLVALKRFNITYHKITEGPYNTQAHLLATRAMRTTLDRYYTTEKNRVSP